MKISVRESINGKNIGILYLQPLLEIFKYFGLGQFFCRFCSQPQTNGIGIIRTYLFLYLHHILFKRGKGFCPIITPVDIGAVSQVMSL